MQPTSQHPTINCCEKTFYCNDHTITEFGIIDSKTPLLRMLYYMSWLMLFGLEQEGGSLIAPMALAHPLHPIDNRSRNRRRNLWVGWCFLLMTFVPVQKLCVNIYIYIYALLYAFCFLWFTNCVVLSDDNSLILGCLWLLAVVLNNTLILDIWCSTIPNLPGCFCPWTFIRISDSTWCHWTPLCHV